MNKHVNLSQIILLGFFLGFITLSCSDDNSSSAGEDAPEIPSTIVNVEPDISYFEQNNPEKASTSSSGNYDNYYSAKYMATSSVIIFTIFDVYSGFLESGMGEEAEYNDGIWSWNYNYNFSGVNSEMSLTAEMGSSSTHWALSWSYDAGEESIDDYIIMEGSVASDGNSGEWTLNSLEEDGSTEIPFLHSQWTIFSETKEELEVEILEDGSSVFYTRSGSEYTIAMDFTDSDSITIYWNTSTSTGYYQEGDINNRLCWDSDFNSVTCS